MTIKNETGVSGFSVTAFFAILMFAFLFTNCKEDPEFIPECQPDQVYDQVEGKCMCDTDRFYAIFGDETICSPLYTFERPMWEATFLQDHVNLPYDTFLIGGPSLAEFESRPFGPWGALMGIPTSWCLREAGVEPICGIDYMYPQYCDARQYWEYPIERTIQSGTELSFKIEGPDGADSDVYLPSGSRVTFTTRILDLNRDCLSEWGKVDLLVEGDTMRGKVHVVDWPAGGPVVFDTVDVLDLVAWRLPFPWDPRTTPPRNR